MHSGIEKMIITRTMIQCLSIALFLSSCRSMTFFETPNNFRNIPATLYLANGRSYDGNLKVHNNRYSGSAIKLFTHGDKKPMRFGIFDVKGYVLNGGHYELKEVKGGMRLNREYSFMKRLTPESSRLHLYENTRKVTRSGAKHTSSSAYFITEHFLHIPGEEETNVWPVTGAKFVPGFDTKMSKLVADCPVLASKISNKEPGYFYAQVSISLEKRISVLTKIIDEYNRCPLQTVP